MITMALKGKIRARMREITKRRMLAAVPKADLVVMNPTHYAVALKYDEALMGAPRVVAKGADLLAMTIRDTARSAQVVSNPSQSILRSPRPEGPRANSEISERNFANPGLACCASIDWAVCR